MTPFPELKVGHFMVAIGAIIEDVDTGNILIVKRNSELNQSSWELIYGRIDQFEEVEAGLRREVFEETGLQDLTIKKLSRIWHIFRGERVAEKEVHGFTFHCTVTQPQVILSEEHSEYAWVPAEKALEMITIEGVKQELAFFIEHRHDAHFALTTAEGYNSFIF